MSAEIVPFPYRGRHEFLRFVLTTYQRRHNSGKAAYVAKVLDANRDRMEQLGIAPDLIAAELAWLEGLFGQAADAKAA
jgi:hypothetical protein